MLWWMVLDPGLYGQHKLDSVSCTNKQNWHEVGKGDGKWLWDELGRVAEDDCGQNALYVCMNSENY